jgi:hypothetical protein
MRTVINIYTIIWHIWYLIPTLLLYNILISYVSLSTTNMPLAMLSLILRTEEGDGI